MTRGKRVCLAVLACLIWAVNPLAKALAEANPDDVEVYLETVEVGEEIYTRWGHLGLRVVDHTSGSDEFYNWGTFDFNAPGFIANYLKGIQIYFLSISPFADSLRIYRNYERRKIWQEKLLLTRTQKAALLGRLQTAKLPENRRYPYHNFFNNCATKVRDIIDDALGGKLKERFIDTHTQRTFRFFVHEALTTEPWAALGLEVIMNSEIDDALTPWQEMFLPVKLREYLLATPAFNDEGMPLPGTSLLGDSSVPIDLPPPAKAPLSGFQLAWLFFGLPTGLAFFAHALANYSESRGHDRSWLRPAAARLTGLSALLLGGWAAVAGTIMLAAWLGSGQTVLHHNANLWIFWPIDWLVVASGVRLLIQGEQRDKSTARSYTVGRNLVTLHALAAVIYLALTLTGIFHQYTTRVAITFLPAMMILGVLLRRYAYNRSRSLEGATLQAARLEPLSKKRR